MTEIANKLEQLLNTGFFYLSKCSEADLRSKSSPEKWSKKEVLGHLIDSAINNLQRFTEIQFEDQPYSYRKYNQNALVDANDYNNAETKDIIDFWMAINKRIISLIQQQTETTLSYKIQVDENEVIDLRFLMVDYVDHLEHHLNQIIQ
ncbi:DinB family protein [Winogradskyella sp. R77965]|uniref:DinB family protein n=1 Tax=Winogradskyella sp. R77965 TaxID=3093872 RepID=UPI0037DC6626